MSFAIAGSIFAGINAVMAGLNTVGGAVRTSREFSGDFENLVKNLKLEVQLAEADLVKFEGNDDSLSVKLMDLLWEIEDYFEKLAVEKHRLLALWTAVNKKLAMDSRNREIKNIEGFLSQMKSIQDRLRGSSSSDVPAVSYPRHNHIGEGFQENKAKLRELLKADGGNLIRISIVGGGGLGKSCLARDVYDNALVDQLTQVCTADEYNWKIWVEGSKCNKSEDVLNEISRKSDLAPEIVENVCQEGDLQKTSERVNQFLHGKKYLIIIDDTCSSKIAWKDLKLAFPENKKDSRMLLTTTVHSIAKHFCSGRYYIFPVQCLGEASSEDLFWKNAIGNRKPSEVEVVYSNSILAACEGLPIALISAANHVSLKDALPYLSENLESMICKELKNMLASGADTFAGIRSMYSHCYKRLESIDLKMCFIYFSTYPQGQSISRKCFARKISAESLVAEETVLKCLDELVDKSIICKTDMKCKVQGMMLQFAACKASALNMVTIVEDGKIRVNMHNGKSAEQMKCRRLAVHSQNTSRRLIPDDFDVTALRSLTVFRSKGPNFVTWIDEIDFKSFKMMRVLDMEGCKGFKSKNCFGSICELWLLKFLNLKSTDLDRITKEVRNLKNLETLDIRDTQAHILPIEVIKLPKLAYLLGNFALPHLSDNQKGIVNKFLQTESKLHTLDGLLLEKDSEFDILLNALCLKKIKVCGNKFLLPSAPAPTKSKGFLKCFSGAASQSKKDDISFRRSVGSLLNTIHSRRNELELISIESDVISNAFVQITMDDAVFRCVKLHGRITTSPGTVFQNNRSIRNICLYDTGLACKKIVEGLQSLQTLEKLKLGKETRPGAWEGDFDVQQGGFPSLRVLCFLGPKRCPQIKISAGSMKLLSSLQLLCRYNVEMTASKANEDLDEDSFHEAYEILAGEDVEMGAPDDVEMGAAEAVVQPDGNAYKMRVEGIRHLTHLAEVILHRSADDGIVEAWKTAAKAHMNLPCVSRQENPSLLSGDF